MATKYLINTYETKELLQEAVIDFIINDRLYNIVHIGDPMDCDPNKLKRITGLTKLESIKAKIKRMTDNNPYCLIYKEYGSKYLKKLKNQLK